MRSCDLWRSLQFEDLIWKQRRDERHEESPAGADRARLYCGGRGPWAITAASKRPNVTPRWAVISAAKRGEGTNSTYCHPRAATVVAVSAALGESDGKPVEAFGGESCNRSGDSEWSLVPSSARLFVTPRDGHVTLTTTGDGEFVRE